MDAVADREADESLSHFAGNVREHLVLIGQLDMKHRARQDLDHDTFHRQQRFHEREPFVLDRGAVDAKGHCDRFGPESKVCLVENGGRQALGRDGRKGERRSHTEFTEIAENAAEGTAGIDGFPVSLRGRNR